MGYVKPFVAATPDVPGSRKRYAAPMFARAPAWMSIIAALLTAAGCSGPAESPERDSILRRGNGGEPQTLNPTLAEDIHAFNILLDLYEGLVTESAEGELVPGAAESWTVSADGRDYTFLIREDAKWSNGEPVTAQQFVDAFRIALVPESQSPYSFLLAPVGGFEAIDSRTLFVRLEAPTPHFLSVLTMPVTYPVYDAASDDPRRFRDAGHFVGNGPYVLDHWAVGDRIRLRVNPEYRRAHVTGIGIVDYYPIDNENSEFNRYRAGELDITMTVPSEGFRDLQRERARELEIAPYLALYYLAFDLSDASLEDRRLRRALSMAVDREAITALLGRGEQPAFSLVPPGVAGYEPAAYDWRHMDAGARIAAARAQYGEAGFGTGEALELKLTYDTGSVHEKVAIAISSMWRDVLDVDVSLEKKEWKHFLATRDNRAEWQVMRFAWFGDYNDASTFLDIFRSGSEQNLPGYRNAEYDGMLAAAAGMTDRAHRLRRLAEAEQRFLDDYAIVPLYFFVSKHLVSPRVRNFHPNVLDRHPTQYLELLTTP